MKYGRQDKVTHNVTFSLLQHLLPKSATSDNTTLPVVSNYGYCFFSIMLKPRPRGAAVQWNDHLSVVVTSTSLTGTGCLCQSAIFCSIICAKAFLALRLSRRRRRSALCFFWREPMAKPPVGVHPLLRIMHCQITGKAKWCAEQFRLTFKRHTPLFGRGD